MNQWYPYPFIFLNLVVSLLASYIVPIIMMGQTDKMQKLDWKRMPIT
ncbi:MAG: DUF1003 domain-containing protein [Candidatus Methanofastidiosum sp.]|nr:DUF1003 domain-containing protein [Methanofastidiosum sp.]